MSPGAGATLFDAVLFPAEAREAERRRHREAAASSPPSAPRAAAAAACCPSLSAAARLPESLIPQVLLDARLKYWGEPVYEARQGNAMWCQDSALDYFDHGVRIRKGMTVVDAGANVGLFALELLERLGGEATVFCFEPVPATCALLRLNVARYPESIRPRVFNCGLSSAAGFVSFKVCPETNIISTSHPDVDPLPEVESLVDFLRSPNAPDVYRRNFPGPFEIHMGWLPRWLVKLVVSQRLKLMAEREDVMCELRTLREVIASHGLSTIDLLKVDVEGAEEMVLEGMGSADWAKVQVCRAATHEANVVTDITRQPDLFHVFGCCLFTAVLRVCSLSSGGGD